MEELCRPTAGFKSMAELGGRQRVWVILCEGRPGRGNGPIGWPVEAGDWDVAKDAREKVDAAMARHLTWRRGRGWRWGVVEVVVVVELDVGHAEATTTTYQLLVARGSVDACRGRGRPAHNRLPMLAKLLPPAVLSWALARPRPSLSACCCCCLFLAGAYSLPSSYYPHRPPRVLQQRIAYPHLRAPHACTSA